MSGSPRFWAGWCKLVRLNYEKEEYSLADYDSIIPNNYLFKEDIADAVVFDRVQAGYEFCRHGAHLTLNSFRKNEPMFIYIYIQISHHHGLFLLGFRMFAFEILVRHAAISTGDINGAYEEYMHKRREGNRRKADGKKSFAPPSTHGRARCAGSVNLRINEMISTLCRESVYGLPEV